MKTLNSAIDWLLNPNSWSRRSRLWFVLLFPITVPAYILFFASGMLGTVYSFAYAKAVSARKNVIVAKFKYSRTEGLVLIDSLPVSTASKTVWNIKSNDFHKVNAIMLSPNFWEETGGIGNKHYFFMIDGCKNDDQARGFYNEFLKEELNPHRKVIEMVGSKMRTENSDNQLSGLGFSSTQRNEILVKVNGAFSRMVKVVF